TLFSGFSAGVSKNTGYCTYSLVRAVLFLKAAHTLLTFWKVTGSSFASPTLWLLPFDIIKNPKLSFVTLSPKLTVVPCVISFVFAHIILPYEGLPKVSFT